MTVTLTKENFEQEVLASNQPVLVDFWAPWCSPCNRLSPLVEELAGELAGKVKVGKVNVDEEHELATQFQVMSIPMLALLKEGRLTGTLVGLRPKESILKLLEE